MHVQTQNRCFGCEYFRQHLQNMRLLAVLWLPGTQQGQVRGYSLKYLSTRRNSTISKHGHRTEQCRTAWHSMAQHGTAAQHITAQRSSTAQHSTAQHSLQATVLYALYYGLSDKQTRVSPQVLAGRGGDNGGQGPGQQAGGVR